MLCLVYTPKKCVYVCVCVCVCAQLSTHYTAFSLEARVKGTAPDEDNTRHELLELMLLSVAPELVEALDLAEEEEEEEEVVPVAVGIEKQQMLRWLASVTITSTTKWT